MLIYRVEHKRYRHGPYRAGGVKTKKCRLLAIDIGNGSLGDRHPAPYSDGITNMQSEDHCGFSSLLQLRLWFGQWFDEMKEIGYHIAVFEVPRDKVKEGGRQVVFPRKSFRRKQALELA